MDRMSGEKIVRVTRWLLPPLPGSSQGGKDGPVSQGNPLPLRIPASPSLAR
jgi:hypothetical protein